MSSMINHIDMSGEDPSLPTSRESAVPTLVSLCRTVICTYMEQYTPESFGICDLDEWEHLIRWRWRMTQPKQRSSQTHTRKPVLPAPILLALEAANPHLDGSLTADQLLWQDCVELGFPRDGSTRPPELLVPWPVLVQRLRVEEKEPRPAEIPPAFLLRLCDSTSWNVALLRDTGLGKVVQRSIKKTKPPASAPHRAALQEVLDAWRALAAAPDPDAVYLPQPMCHRPPCEVAEDLRRAERATTWKQLFLILQERKAQRQAAQGQRMRNIRDALEKNRPKLVKVRPAVSSSSKSLPPPPSSSNDRMTALRNEVRQQTRQLQAPGTKKASFGDAVAFCSLSQKGIKKRKTLHQPLGNGRSMKVPAHQGKATPRRAMASSWKKPPPSK